jgi:hypothetical protein
MVLVPVVHSIRHLLDSKQLSGVSCNSQYVDDMALSGDIKRCGELIDLIFGEFRRHGLKLSRRKTAIMWASQPQIVTGQLVNRRLAVPNEERSRIRAAVHTLENTNATQADYDHLYRSVSGKVYRLRKYHPTIGNKLLQRVKNLPAPTN